MTTMLTSRAYSSADALPLTFEDFGNNDKIESAKMMRMAEVNSRLAILSKNRECQDMHVKLFEATVTNSRLMEQMSQLAFENQQLRLQMLAIREENEELHSQLSYSSQRWTNGYIPACKRWFQNQSIDEDPNDDSNLENLHGTTNESWEEVSQKLLNQMQQEMKEMEDLGQRLAAENNATFDNTYQKSDDSTNVKTPETAADAGIDDVDLERVRTLIQGMKGQSEHLKNQLATQSIVLESALNQLKKATKTGAVILTKKAGIGDSSSGDISKNKFDRPSDELFRAYFTQQLHNSSGSQPCQRSSDTDERSNSEETKEKTFEQTSRSTQEHSPEEKICPVCEASFPFETPLEEFQNHVMDHFENENSTLLQQYELL